MRQHGYTTLCKHGNSIAIAYDTSLQQPWCFKKCSQPSCLWAYQTHWGSIPFHPWTCLVVELQICCTNDKCENVFIMLLACRKFEAFWESLSTIYNNV